MKLSEALALRADLRVRVGSLEQRLQANALVQEGDRASEDCAELLAEIRSLLDQLRDLMVRINRTNLQARLADGRTLTDAIAERDIRRMEIAAMRKLIQEASPTGKLSYRVGRSEIKFTPTVNVAELHRTVDRLQRDYRLLDSALQMANFTHDLVED